MSTRVFALLVACVFASIPTTTAVARGFGGGFHGGGFGGAGVGGAGALRGGFGGQLGGGALDRGALGAGGLGASGLGDELSRGDLGAGGPGGQEGRVAPGGLEGRFGAGALGGAAPTRSQLNSFLGLPSDEGLHNLTSNPFAQAGGLGSAFDVQHGSVEGPRGGEATGTAVEGPRGGAAARGVAVGPEGRVAGGSAARGPEGGAAARGFVAGPHGYAAGFVRVSPSDRYAAGVAVRGNFHDWGVFGPGWYTDHPGAWFAAGWAAGRYWWPCTWAALGDYFYVLPIDDPVYYDYGNTVVYQNNDVYVNGQDAGTAQQYYNQAESLATTGAQANAPSDGDWLPLGVFALAKTDAQTSNMILQLAINKQGVLRGNYQDTADNNTQPVHGSADLKTQRVAFTVGDKKEMVIETGLYNLTKDEAPVLIHFGPDRTEQWLLVRLKQPDEGAAD